MPVALFQEMETKLLDVLLEKDGSESHDETDGPIQFKQNIAETVKRDFDGLLKMEKEKPFLIFSPKFLQLSQVQKQTTLKK